MDKMTRIYHVHDKQVWALNRVQKSPGGRNRYRWENIQTCIMLNVIDFQLPFSGIRIFE